MRLVYADSFSRCSINDRGSVVFIDPMRLVVIDRRTMQVPDYVVWCDTRRGRLCQLVTDDKGEPIMARCVSNLSAPAAYVTQTIDGEYEILVIPADIELQE